MTMFNLTDDPLTIPWHGYAAWGNTRFDTTLISHIEGNLYVGGCIDGVVLPDDFEFVLSLYPWEKYQIGPNTTRLEFTMYDDAISDEYVLGDIAMRGAEMLSKGKTLIHCQAGLNRSVLVSVLALNIDTFSPALTKAAALDLIREMRSPACCCNPYYQDFLLR